MRRLITLSIIIFLGSSCINVYAKALTTSLGMANVSYAENTASLQDPDDATSTATEQASGASSFVSADLVYEYSTTPTRSFFTRVIFPMTSAGGNTFYLGGIGVNYFFFSMSENFHVFDSGTTFQVSPNQRFYIGAQVGGGYLIYSTETARKSDILFELGGQLGMIYNFRDSYGGKLEVSVGRGTGVSTSTLNTRFFIGMVYSMGK